MKLSHLSLVFAILVLASCNHQVVPSIAEHSNSSTITGEEQISTYNSKYLHLLDIVERMRVLIEEAQEKARNLTDAIPSDGMTAQEYEAALNSRAAAHASQLIFINNIYDKTSELLNKTQNINGYLSFLLNLRFEYLSERKKMIEETLSPQGLGAIHIFPTSKAFFDYLMSDSRYTRHKDYNEVARIYSVSRFELLNLLIKESFNSCIINELSKKTIDLLRSSIQLHPILTDEQKDLGHPDEAGGPYAILEPLILASDKPTSTHIESLRAQFKIPMVIKTAEELSPEDPHITAIKGLFLHISSIDLNTEMNLDPLYHFNELRRGLDLSVYEAHFVLNKQFILPFKNIGTPQGHGLPLTLYEAGKWTYDLPYPHFLTITQREDIAQLAQPVGLQEKEEIEAKRTKSDKEEEIVSEINPSKKNAEEVLTVGLIQATTEERSKKEIKEEYSPNQEAIKIAEEIKRYEEEIEEIKEASITLAFTNPVVDAAVRQPANTFSFTSDWQLPHGLRSFHSQMLSCAYPSYPLNGAHQAVVDQLFDPQQQCNVTFKAFKNLWQTTGGQIISNHSGSHRELIGPQQEKLFGIFAHNNNQTYGKNYVKYLQTAVLYVGLRPSQGLSKANK